ncbi:MAG: rbsA [Subtercola sp.]|nr:rbsA [Subtercola sp.]
MNDFHIEVSMAERPNDRAARPEAAVDPSAVLALRNISKRYPGVLALSDVDFTLYPGTVHAISGENGAGKSTLSKVLSGIIQPDAGRIFVDSQPVTIPTPTEARRLGISAVPQELSLVPDLSVAENIGVIALPSRGGFVSRRALRAQAEPVLHSLGLKIDPLSRLGDHSPGIQQLVMIGRSLVHQARVIILDEPTAALTEPEVRHLFEVVKRERETGTAFVLVSHRFQDLARLADTVTVLRDGCHIITSPMAELTHDDMVRAMVGRTVERFVHDAQVAPGADTEVKDGGSRPRLSVRHLSSAGKFDNVSFDVRPGEIVGLGGLLGAGRTEVARAVFGVDGFTSGEVFIDGEKARITSPRKAIKAGLMMVPEERKSQALVLSMSIRQNLTSTGTRRISRGGWLRPRKERDISLQLIQQLGIKATGPEVLVGTLSGGNQQKVVIGRCFLDDFSVYIFDEPTRGVDINAKFQIYRLINSLAKKGAGVLLISSELPELLAVADRILVMREGRLVADLPADTATEEQILSSAMV